MKDQAFVDAIFAKFKRPHLFAAAIAEAEPVQAPPPAAGDPTHVFRAMRRSRQGLAIYEREP